jgi:hypothetical protein
MINNVMYILLTRKFLAYTYNVKFETYFFSYNGTGPS